jgi:membrane-anchored protein YejM (alkaline phosphatase superfamily)
MSNWPDWFLEALRQRFYQLELASEQQASCLPEDESLLVQIEQFKTNQNEEIQHMLSEWQEWMDDQQSQHKQFIYMEGVKDGIRLILPVIQSTDIR